MVRIIISLCFIVILKNGSCAKPFEDSLYYHLLQFQIETGELKKEDIKDKDFKSKFYISDLVEEDNKGNIKLYQFHNLVYEEANVNIILLNQEKVELFEIKNIGLLLDVVINIEDDNLTDEIKVIWIKQLLKLHSDHISKGLTLINLEKTVGNYTYNLTVD